jgi:hypothetical protein
MARVAPAACFASSASMLARVPRPRVAVREGRDGDVDPRARIDAGGAGHAGDPGLLVGGALGLDAVDELHELGGALQVTQVHVVLGGARGRVSAQREEAADAGVEELADETVGTRIGVAHAREVRQRLDIGRGANVTQHLERASAGGSAGTVRHRDEPRPDLGEARDRLVQSRL